jgi:hypothetical protein
MQLASCCGYLSQAVFAIYDDDKSGSLDEEEFTHALSILGRTQALWRWLYPESQVPAFTCRRVLFTLVETKQGRFSELSPVVLRLVVVQDLRPLRRPPCSVR